MKTALIAAVALAAGSASADIYNDMTGTAVAPGVGDIAANFSSFTHLDIAQVEITNDSTWLTIAITVVGDMDATNWGKYGIGIDTGKSVGSNSNGWGRNIDWGRNINVWSASWADDGGSGVGGEFYSYDDGGAAWNLLGATWNGDTNIQGDDSNHPFTQTWRFKFADIGLALGDTIEFDVITTGGGGGDPGVDHLSRSAPATTDWPNQSVAGQFRSYTLVPAPGSLALLGLGGLAARRRR